MTHVSDLQGIGLTVGGTIAKVQEFANVLQVCVDAGVKKVLIPAGSVMDLQTLKN